MQLLTKSSRYFEGYLHAQEDLSYTVQLLFWCMKTSAHASFLPFADGEY